AEDGIRYFHVTGVQTCALPISGFSLEQLGNDFGDKVAQLVDGVTKLDKVKLGTAAEAETIRKMVIAMARDPRVLVIKLADRLHRSEERRVGKARRSRVSASRHT